MEILLPETVTHSDGVGQVFEPESNTVQWLLTLDVTRILERETLDVIVNGSPDGEHWLPLVSFPRKSYCGTYSQRLDLGNHPGVRYLRAEWKMTRWDPRENTLLCAFSLSAKPARVLHAGAV